MNGLYLLLILVQIALGIFQCTRWNHRPFWNALFCGAAWIALLTLGGAWH